MKTGLPDHDPKQTVPGVSGEAREALQEFYEKYFPKVYKYFRFRVQDPQCSDDLTAKVFLKAVEHFPNYSPERSSLATWVFTIARNTLIDHYRAGGSRTPVSLETAEQLADPKADQENDQLKREEREILLAALLSLAERERDIIALKFAAGMSNVEIARQTGLGESHVGVLIYRSLAKLKKILADQL